LTPLSIRPIHYEVKPEYKNVISSVAISTGRD
jgi:hypothetical protein